MSAVISLVSGALAEEGKEDAEGKKKEEALPAGHSVHGEVFNEGPRQGAVWIEGTGDIDFKVTTKDPEAQKFFHQGVGQLHGFWYFEAERSFRQVLRLDPDCAMAYWGLVMANFSNKTRVEGFIKKAKEKLDGVSEREKMWINSLVRYFEKPKEDENKRRRELVRDIEKIVRAHPDDVEAKAFLLYQIYSNAKKKDGYKVPSNLMVDHYASAIHQLQPNHPCHHYRIHLWDSEDPKQALHNAAQCGPAAPGIAHMWHMPGHIYSKLHRYRDAAWQQEASARVDHAHQMRFGLIPDQIHNFAHNNEWLIRNLQYLGRHQDAIDLAKNMIELPRRPKFSGDKKTWQHSGSSWAYGRTRLRDCLMGSEKWDQLLQVAETDYLKPGPDTINEREWQRMVGVAAFMKGDAKRGLEQLAALNKKLADKKAAKDKAVADAEKKNTEAKKSEKEIAAAKKKAGDNFSKDITALTNNGNELTVCDLLYADSGELKLSEADSKKVAGLLPKLKTVSKSRLAQLYLRSGDKDKAVKTAAEGVSAAAGQVLPVAHRVEILFAAGKNEEAFKAFEEMRKRAADADLNLPVFARVIAKVKAAKGAERKELVGVDLDGDWRMVIPPAKDLGPRPAHDELGPFRWSPQQAPEWTLNNAAGKKVSLQDYRGDPVLVIFYLGKGCVHCMEQLQAFSPQYEKYQAAGIEIVAISLDSEAGLRETYDGKKNPFPFPLLSNESVDAFRAYRAYDDFENSELHGTYLIDGQGRIRWQDISWEPFMKPDWLLEECQRLLSLEGGRS